MATFPDNHIDLTVTSPPYDNLRDYNGYDFNFEGIANQLYRITKQGGVLVWVVGDETKNFCESLNSFKQAIYFVENCGFNLLDTMIYKKVNYAPAYPNMKRYAQNFEYMFVLTKGKPKVFNPIRVDKKPSTIARQQYKHVGGYRQKDGSFKKSETLSGGNVQKDACNVWEYVVGGNYTNDKYALKHPAVFPEKLANDHILSWSNDGDLILDPMCGSGTTCKMAMVNKRNYIGIDISEEYCAITRRRIAEHEQQQTLFEGVQ